MIKKIIFGAALLVAANALAQQGTASPYSFYGYGDKHFKGPNEIKTMGALAVFNDSLHLNTLNPASYSDLMGTTFSFGASYKENHLRSSHTSDKTNSGSFDYLSVAFPTGKFGVAFGIMPYSFVGYNIQNSGKINGMTEVSQYMGEGGLNRTFLGLSYKINKNFNIGVEGAFLFGNTETNLTKFITNNGQGMPIPRGSRAIDHNYYSGFSINTALNYKQTLNNKLTVFSTVTFSPELELNNDLTQTFETVEALANGQIIEVDTKTTSKSGQKMLLPMNYSLGVGLGNTLKWFVGAEYTAAETSKYNSFYNYDNAIYNNYYKIGVGGFYTPKYNSFTSYLERMTYRAGVNYENTGLVINNEAIKGYNANIGLGLPVGRYNSNINIGFEYGQRGNTNSGLIKENYYGINIGLSFTDFWFQRRKFD